MEGSTLVAQRIEGVLVATKRNSIEAACLGLFSIMDKGVALSGNSGIRVGWLAEEKPAHWAHILCLGVNGEALEYTNSQLGLDIPDRYVDFLRIFNGVSLFRAEFGIPHLLMMGVAPNPRVLSPEEDHSADFLADNTITRISTLERGELVFGSYASDGDLISISQRGVVRRRSREGGYCREME
jgi:hypothetical protein